VGFDMKMTPGLTYSPGTFFHEGAGACNLTIDPKEELVAAWIVPFKNNEWYPCQLFNVTNIIWSGLL